MIVDSSALVAVVFREEGYEQIREKLVSSPSTGVGTPTLTETGIVLSAGFGQDASGLVHRLLDEFGIVEIPFGRDHRREAVSAFWRFGRGRHPARLNFGGCLTYAVASLAQEPLLFVGDDFSQTDLAAA